MIFKPHYHEQCNQKWSWINEAANQVQVHVDLGITLITVLDGHLKMEEEDATIAAEEKIPCSLWQVDFMSTLHSCLGDSCAGDSCAGDSCGCAPPVAIWKPDFTPVLRWYYSSTKASDSTLNAVNIWLNTGVTPACETVTPTDRREKNQWLYLYP